MRSNALILRFFSLSTSDQMFSFYVSFLYLHEIKYSHFTFLFFIYMRSNVLILHFFSNIYMRSNVLILRFFSNIYMRSNVLILRFFSNIYIRSNVRILRFFSLSTCTWDQVFSFYVSFLYLHEIKCSHFMFLFFIYMRSNVLILRFFLYLHEIKCSHFMLLFFIYMWSNFLVLCFFSSTTQHQNVLVCGLGLWCLMPLSTIFQLYRASLFYCLKFK